MSADFEGLGAGGRELVDSIVAQMATDNLVPDARETALLLTAGELRDRMDDLAAAIEEDGLRVVSSTGVVRLHPAAGELRQHAVALSRVLSGVAMSELGAGKSARHVRAAQTRWARQDGRSG
ncbi:hypothetical protein [Cellulomonas sp. URHB0016]